MSQGSLITACDTGEVGGGGVEDIIDSVVVGGGGGVIVCFGKGPLGGGGGTNGAINGPVEADAGIGAPLD